MNAAVRAGAVSYATAWAFNAVGDIAPSGIGNVIGHAAVGCASSVASGGSCQSGALSGAVGSMYSQGGPKFGSFEANLVAHAVAGGVGSVIAGGKFENGAVTAAFGYLFNELQHYERMSDERLRMGGYEIKDYIRYEQSTGQMYLIDGLTGGEKSLGQGYAGRGVGFNNPEAQNIPNIGPIPEGLYAIGSIRDNRVRIGLPNERVMESSLRLTPMTNIGSRAGFLIHSDFGVTTASNGCICTPLSVRQVVANTGVTRLQVVK
jgi:hypothetical protein